MTRTPGASTPAAWCTAAGNHRTARASASSTARTARPAGEPRYVAPPAVREGSGWAPRWSWWAARSWTCALLLVGVDGNRRHAGGHACGQPGWLLSGERALTGAPLALQEQPHGPAHIDDLAGPDTGCRAGTADRNPGVVDGLQCRKERLRIPYGAYRWQGIQITRAPGDHPLAAAELASHLHCSRVYRPVGPAVVAIRARPEHQHVGVLRLTPLDRHRRAAAQ